jgi:hypothetical protein
MNFLFLIVNSNQSPLDRRKAFTKMLVSLLATHRRRQQIGNRLQLARRILFAIGTLVASVCLYFAIVAGLIGVPGALPSVFWDRIFPLLCLGCALAADFSVAWLWHRRSRRSLVSAFLIVAGTTIGGALLISFGAMRGQWLEVMKEVIRRI